MAGVGVCWCLRVFNVLDLHVYSSHSEGLHSAVLFLFD
jgi:hypothetical protein